MKFNSLNLVIMLKYANVITLIFLLLFVNKSYTQSVNMKKVESINVNYQKCLDSGVDMLGCSNKYFFFCDKLLNEVYQIIRQKLSEKEKTNLRNDQLKWLKERDLFFIKAVKIAKEEAEDLPEEDLQMIYMDKKSEYVKERVVFLIKKYKV